MADNSYFQSPSVDYSQFYSGSMAPPTVSGGMLRPTPLGATNVANAAYRPPNPAQLAAISAVPPNSYQRPGPAPINSPNIPYGSAYADTGNLGRATPEMQQLIQLASAGGGRPGWTIPQAPTTPNVPLPRPRPGYAPTSIDIAAMNRPQGANPGMGGAMLGNGAMSPNIPPQGPPPAGISPTVWAGDNANPMTGGVGPYRGAASDGYTAPGAPRPLTAAERYSLANQYGQQAAQQRQASATGVAGGYQYENGQRVGYAPQTIGGVTFTPGNAATAYGLANAAGQIDALNRQANATGQTGVYNYINGVRGSTVNGQSSANAYAAANSGPGSVAAFERFASGGGSSGGPAVGGEYGGGISNDGPRRPWAPKKG